MGDSVGLGLSNVGVGGWVVVGVEIGRGSGSHCRDSRGSDLNSSWLSSHRLGSSVNHLNLLRGRKSCGFGGSISCGELRLGSSNLLSVGQVRRGNGGCDFSSSWNSRHGLRGRRNHLTLLRGSKGSSFGGSISCGKLCLGSSNLLSVGQVCPC